MGGRRNSRGDMAGSETAVVNDNERIANQIEGLGDRRLLGCFMKTLLILALGGIVLHMVVRQSEDTAKNLAVMLAISGLVMGYATSYLRTVLKVVMATVPLAATFVMFVMRTVLGWSNDLPLLMTLAPLVFGIAFLIGQLRQS